MCGEQSTPSELSRSNPWIFDICCFCVPVSVGCFILAYLQLIAFIGTAILSVIGIFTGVFLMSYRTGDADYNTGVWMLVVNIVIISIVLISLPFTIVLIVGLHKENRKYIKVYLIYTTLCLITCSVLLVLLFITAQSYLMDAIPPVLSIVVNIYFLLVYRSHYLKLKWERSNEI